MDKHKRNRDSHSCELCNRGVKPTTAPHPVVGVVGPTCHRHLNLVVKAGRDSEPSLQLALSAYRPAKRQALERAARAILKLEAAA